MYGKDLSIHKSPYKRIGKFIKHMKYLEAARYL